jgi:hypothetical protein
MGGALSSMAGAILPLESIHNNMVKTSIYMMELDLLPDFVTRRGIRYLLSGREGEVMSLSIVYTVHAQICHTE